MGKSTSAKIANPSHNPQWDRWSYRIGCPVWGCKQWTDLVYPKGTSTDDYLRWYSYSFPTVEGNSTFYGVPPKSTFEKWSQSAAETFQFCFKFPRKISHELKLRGCDEDLRHWLACLEILRNENKLGPTFLQLAPSFSFAYFRYLELFLEGLPQDWPWAVEVRHQDWFDESEQEKRLDELLQRLGIDKVLFDSRPLNALEATDSTEQTSQTRKPKTPFRTSVTGSRPMLRLIGRNDAAEIAGYWEWWSEKIAEWIRAGYEPYIFTHAPDDQYAPGLAKLLHEMIRIHLPELPLLPSTISQLQQGSDQDDLKQLRLF